MAYEVVSARFMHDFKDVLDEAEKKGYKLVHFAHDDGCYFGVMYVDDDA